ncbi:NAD(P)H-dependent oxidoreductase [Paraburkholderia sp. FT54]|jgi:FMN-dependent NADH-azoreductase|uniref:FMN-dependent NADH-azoreductase n=1 Tax=Paraburkholderia sp. FT54 TaxID=3074437 RepID=UPI0028780A6F|nr:NAD(P)H-dependent oxidoreductase [Paraburkholderia sp. FT54]WNC88095.1 NAD(P)H-dependent oxidoreductase [Paraburkholderia sp. FT54]
MSKLLLIKASPRGIDSATGKLADLFVNRWLEANPGAIVTRRDTGPGNVTGPDQSWVVANLTAENDRTVEQRLLLAQSDEFIEELRWATHVVIAAPMYNFSVPWNLKAYFDNIVREGETFFFSPDTGHGPLLPAGKKLLLVWTAAGDYSAGTEMAPFDFLTPYVRGVFAFIGITDFSVISVGSRSETPELANTAMKLGIENIAQLGDCW